MIDVESNVVEVFQLQGIHTLSQPMHSCTICSTFDNATAKMVNMRSKAVKSFEYISILYTRQGEKL